MSLFILVNMEFIDKGTLGKFFGSPEKMSQDVNCISSRF